MRTGRGKRRVQDEKPGQEDAGNGGVTAERQALVGRADQGKSGDEQDQNGDPDKIRRPAVLLDFNEGGQGVREEDVEVAEGDEQAPGPLGHAGGGFLVKGEGISEKKPGCKQGQPSRAVEQIPEDMLPAVGDERPDEHRRNPDHGDERPGLRRIPGPLGQERGNEDIGKEDRQEPGRLAGFFPQQGDNTEERKNVDRSVKKQPVSLVEEVAGQGFPAEPERDPGEEILDETQRLPAVHGSLPGNGRRIQ